MWTANYPTIFLSSATSQYMYVASKGNTQGQSAIINLVVMQDNRLATTSDLYMPSTKRMLISDRKNLAAEV